MITIEEKQLARECLDFALQAGASDARITLTKSTEDLIATLDGQVDRVTRCADRSLSIAIFAGGSFGSFSSNKIERDSLRTFINEAVATVRMLAPDPYRRLPDPERCCKDAQSGFEMQIYDEAYQHMTAGVRSMSALDAAVFGKDVQALAEGAALISEEGEYSDSEYDVYVIDTHGLECRHTETSFDYGVEVTIQDAEGNKYSDYWWTASPRLADFDPVQCGVTALKRACAQIGSEPLKSGRYNMVVSSNVASRLVSPLLNALNAYSIQQGNSFLVDSLGKQVFSDKLCILDEPWRKGESGSKLFDSEGVRTSAAPIIENGVIKRYFVNTYMSGKLGMDPTGEDAVRPLLKAFPKAGTDESGLMDLCGDGILVTDFNGGNCNMATGDFSYGIAGQLFRDGKTVRPVSEMLITGNFLTLWKNLIASGDDFRSCSPKLIGSLAFSEVDFSG